VTTFAAALAATLRTDPGRAFVTYYDLGSGERTELSATTYANWVAKTASLFVEELDLERGQCVLVDLPAHWLTPVFVGAAWTAGLVVVDELSGEADAVVCGPAGLAAYADRAAQLPVIATALHPLGLRFTDPLPEDVHDFGVEVWSQPDAFMPWDPPTDEDAARPGVTQAELVGATATLAPRDRLLTDASPVPHPHVLVEAVTGNGSLVIVASADAFPDQVGRVAETERTTATYLIHPD
jgi:uncharacterized protein (TIGR03089 family)